MADLLGLARDDGEGAKVLVRREAAPHGEKDRLQRDQHGQQQEAPGLELLQRLEDLGEVEPLLPVVRGGVRQLVRQNLRVVEHRARRVERRALGVRQRRGGPLLGEHLLQREDEDLERDRERAALEARARHEGVAELGGEGGVQPDGRRLGVERREAEALRARLLRLLLELGHLVAATEQRQLLAHRLARSGEMRKDRARSGER